MNRTFAYLYIITMTISFTTRYADFRFGTNFIQLLIGLIWVSIAVVNYLLTQKNSVRKKDTVWLIKSYLIPQIIIHCYTVILILCGFLSSNAFSTNITIYIPILVAISSIYLFGINSFKYTFYALIMSWTLSVFSSILYKGPGIIIYAIIQAYIDTFTSFGGYTTNYFELHDVVLAIGYVICFYIFDKIRLTKKNFFIILSAMLIMTMGMKRIAILAIVICFIFHKLVNLFSDKKQYKLCLIAGGLITSGAYIFIWILNQGSEFFSYMLRFGSDFLMGRNYYWTAVLGKISFSPSFLGLGRNSLTKLFNSEFSYMNVSGVHSDILKMYAENGFILFGIWLIYYMLIMTKKYRKYLGIKAALCYFTISIYTFILYFTDNTEVYYICIIFSIIIPFCYAIRQRNEFIYKYKKNN